MIFRNSFPRHTNRHTYREAKPLCISIKTEVGIPVRKEIKIHIYIYVCLFVFPCFSLVILFRNSFPERMRKEMERSVSGHFFPVRKEIGFLSFHGKEVGANGARA